MTRAQVDLSGAAREVEVDRGSRDSAYVLLGFVLNAPIPTGLARPDALLAAADRRTETIDSLISTAIATRPDLAALRHTATAAHDFAAEPLLRSTTPTASAPSPSPATRPRATRRATRSPSCSR